MMNQHPPMMVRIVRGNTLESEHFVDAVVADRSGARQVWGDQDRVLFPRSAIKAIQALPLITTGAAEHFGLTTEQLALACSSHSGEEQHVETVSGWLADIGGSSRWLECGPARPLSNDAWLDVGRRLTPVHNCCSGKHAGFLTVSAHLGADHNGYVQFDHPIQRLVTQATKVFTGLPLSAANAGIDGCGIPTFPMPVSRIAKAMAQLVDPADVGQEWADASHRIVSAIKDLPWWVSGTGRHEVALSELASEPLVSKSGADGVFTAALPERGLGIACKARDGAQRASDAAMTAVLARLGVVPAEAASQPILNTLSEVVGAITVEAQS